MRICFSYQNLFPATSRAARHVVRVAASVVAGLVVDPLCLIDPVIDGVFHNARGGSHAANQGGDPTQCS